MEIDFFNLNNSWTLNLVIWLFLKYLIKKITGNSDFCLLPCAAMYWVTVYSFCPVCWCMPLISVHRTGRSRSVFCESEASQSYISCLKKLFFCLCACMCAFVGRGQRLALGVFLNNFLPYFWRQSFTGPGPDVTSPAGQHLHLSNAELRTWLFYLGAGTELRFPGLHDERFTKGAIDPAPSFTTSM